ncbi:cytochrome c oxidase subunit II [Natronospirillum operosum]|uniref:cytochrome c oxidase subunit II n=1 Tax=Natronospirillum operosum TaxID=2759953 RepID=UPI00197BDCD6|nr:cytochrome c oxidase subunit II [Natronospirillum operosum]
MTRLAAMISLGILMLLGGCAGWFDGPLSTLQPAGPAAHSAALLWWGMFLFATLVLIAVTALWIIALRRDPGEVSDADAQRQQNRWIWGGGLALPLGSITVLLAFGIPMGHSMLPLPAEDRVEIEVTGYQWGWRVEYPEQGIELQNEVVIPSETAVDIILRSEDVIHSFWVPRLAGKTDLIPGHTNTLRLVADEPGTYHGVCAEFCGVGHAHMQFTAEALSPDDYATWLSEQAAQQDEGETDD